MALHSRKEFYEKCGVSKAYLNVNISRGKVILTGNMIDDALPENAYFLEKRTDKGEGSTPAAPVKSKRGKPKKAVTAEQVEIIQKKREEEGPDPDEETRSKWGLEKEQKRLAIIKAEEDIELAKMKREKMAGQLIPTDLVINLFAAHSKNITTNFHQAVESLLSNISKQIGLDRKQVAEIRGQLIEVINLSVKDSVAASRKDIDSIVGEYSQKRDREGKE